MSARRNLHPTQFGDISEIPPEFGTQPIPEGHVRFNHYTYDEAVPHIQREGLQLKAAKESYAKGGTEFPATFATAGAPKEELLRSRPVVEFHAHPDTTSLGWPSRTPRTYPAEDIQHWEGRRSVATMGDVPRSAIIAIHQPWHQAFRYLAEDPSREAGIMAGNYDDVDEDTDKAVGAMKLALAAKVMLGGKLQGKSW